MAIDKKINFEVQGGIKNYLGKQKEVKAPLKWQSSPDHPSTELAYITQAEKNLLIKQDLHGSLKGGANRGPSGIMSLNGWGDSDGKGGTDTTMGNAGGGGADSKTGSDRDVVDQKYSGDGMFSGYRNLDAQGQPLMGMAYAGDRLGNLFSPGNIAGGVLGLINPLAGLAYKGYNYAKNKAPQTLNTFQQSPTLMDFYNNMKTTPVNNTIDIRDKFNRTEGLSDVRPVQTFEFDPTNFNNTANYETTKYDFDEIDNQVAELTDKQKAFINNQKTAIELGIQTPQDVYNKITNPNYPIYKSGILGFGEQEPTTIEEYNNYLQSIGINQRIV
jgi:hypothetical protein